MHKKCFYKGLPLLLLVAIKCKFKNKLIFESYLEKIKNINKRTCFTRIRIRAHELKIERVRYFRPMIPATERYCDIYSL